ncbi:hypothetical protein KAFR_0A08120 [Kazachstania africana CBS 2517]|uniref:Uncharacterized protein n=1 Tax=Kazachstania africana (strain ATCC 22294 / BCRC 22015 / CBS 2517 / CECT 1963 / NBRC 1671 / NRRL Y-8276) TaxID=1071382 RepID=H2APE6_KAZAF|nr:hypothetical protein KAFR_0A08120 [Kazachstania africana CBS 2517]CCF56246.1 hypothetical protein KAFR_0A08120 [Kazachstania africana CBS 2517]
MFEHYHSPKRVKLTEDSPDPLLNVSKQLMTGHTPIATLVSNHTIFEQLRDFQVAYFRDPTDSPVPLNASSNEGDSNARKTDTRSKLLLDKNGDALADVDHSSVPKPVLKSFNHILNNSKFKEYFEKILIKVTAVPEHQSVTLRNGYQVVLICKICQHAIYLNSSSSGNAGKHLATHENLKTITKAATKNLTLQRKSLSIMDKDLERELRTSQFSQLAWILYNDVSFGYNFNRIISGGFNFNYNPLFNPVSLWDVIEIKSKILDIDKKFKTEIRKLLKETNLVSLIINTWDFYEKYPKYLALIATFVPNIVLVKSKKTQSKPFSNLLKNNFGQLQNKVVLGVIDRTKLDNEQIATSIYELLLEYNIVDKLFSITGNFINEEKKITDLLQKRIINHGDSFSMMTTINRKETLFNIDSLEKITNTLIKVAYKNMNSSVREDIETVKNIAKSINGSPSELRRSFMGSGCRRLLHPVVEDEVSTAYLLKQFTEDWKFISNLEGKDFEIINTIKKENIESLELLVSSMAPLLNLDTLAKCDNTNSLINIPLYDNYIASYLNNFEELNYSNPHQIQNVRLESSAIETAKDEWNHFMDKNEILYNLCEILTPYLRSELHDAIPKVETNLQKLKTVSNASNSYSINALRFLIEFRGNVDIPIPQDTGIEEILASLDENNEIKKYLSDDLLPIPHTINDAMNLYFHYWTSNMNTYPTLSPLALHLLYVKSSGIDTEKMFFMCQSLILRDFPIDQELISALIRVRNNVDLYESGSSFLENSLHDSLLYLKMDLLRCGKRTSGRV